MGSQSLLKLVQCDHTHGSHRGCVFVWKDQLTHGIWRRWSGAAEHRQRPPAFPCAPGHCKNPEVIALHAYLMLNARCLIAVNKEAPGELWRGVLWRVRESSFIWESEFTCGDRNKSFAPLDNISQVKYSQTTSSVTTLIWRWNSESAFIGSGKVWNCSVGWFESKLFKAAWVLQIKCC